MMLKNKLLYIITIILFIDFIFPTHDYSSVVNKKVFAQNINYWQPLDADNIVASCYRKHIMDGCLFLEVRQVQSYNSNPVGSGSFYDLIQSHFIHSPNCTNIHNTK